MAFFARIQPRTAVFKCDLISDFVVLFICGFDRMSKSGCLVTVEAMVNGHRYRPIDFLDRVRVPYGVATLQPCSESHFNGAEFLTLELDLPSGFKYTLQFNGKCSESVQVVLTTLNLHSVASQYDRMALWKRFS